MHAHEVGQTLRRLNLCTLLVAALAALILVSGWASRAAQSGRETRESDGEEREFKNTVPAHVPLKVKVKNERAFKDHKNREWARELEIEVTNTGSKPIYLLFLVFKLDDFRLEDGNSLAFGIRYGRKELLDLDAPLQPDDVPIRPGESITLKIPESQSRGYGNIRDRRNKADAKKIVFEMQFIRFDDGTGLEMPQGVPAHKPSRGHQENLATPKQTARTCQSPPRRPAAKPLAKFLMASSRLEPASFLRVDFSTAVDATASPALPVDCNCQNLPNCFFGKLQCPNHCPCDNNCQFLAHISTGNCSDPAARCRQVELVHEPCPTTFHGEQTCSFDTPIATCAIGSPTPTPTPTPPPPTPTPTPVSCPESQKECGCCIRVPNPAIAGGSLA